MTSNMKFDDLILIPESRSGVWSVERYTVSQEDSRFEHLRAMTNPSSMGRYVPAGTYTALKRNGELIMSTTPDELRDLALLRRASGSVLIGGLGLGVAISQALSNGRVTSITVVEISDDVIRLVAPYMPPCVVVIHADIFTWKPPKDAYYDLAWFDIWDNICADNKSEMRRLKRRFARHADRCFCWSE